MIRSTIAPARRPVTSKAGQPSRPPRGLLLLGIAALVVACLLFAAQVRGQDTRPAITCDRWVAIMQSVSQNALGGAMAAYDGASVVACGDARYGSGWKARSYMHSSDHEAALSCLLGREPTALEVYDSWARSGSSNIAKAREQCGGPGDGSVLSCLIDQLGVSRGSRLYDRLVGGERPTLPVELTAAQVCGGEVAPTPPPPEPTPAPSSSPTPCPSCPPPPPRRCDVPLPSARVLQTLRVAPQWTLVEQRKEWHRQVAAWAQLVREWRAACEAQP